MVRITLHDDAAEELEESVVWYERRQAGLGSRFLHTVLTVFERILAAPAVGTPVQSARRVPVPGFPYSVFYRIRGEELLVVAVAHHRRRSGYWRRR
jgi:plasmid stabilization system protein ParE